MLHVKQCGFMVFSFLNSSTLFAEKYILESLIFSVKIYFQLLTVHPLLPVTAF